MALADTESILAPATRAAAVTPNDGADLPLAANRGLWVGGAGNIVLVTVGGDTVTISGCAAGTVVPLRVKRVRATSTTATNIVALI